MKNLTFNFKSIVQTKARWLLTFCALLTLGVGQVWADTYHLAYQKDMPSGNWDAANKVAMTQSSNNSNRYYCELILDGSGSYGFFIIKNYTGVDKSGTYYKANATASSNRLVKLYEYDTTKDYGGSANRVTYTTGSAGTYIFSYD